MDFTTANKTVNLQIAREYKSLLKLSYQTLNKSDKVLIATFSRFCWEFVEKKIKEIKIILNM